MLFNNEKTIATNSLVTMTVSVFIPLHIYSRRSRDRHVNSSGKRISKTMYEDVKKLSVGYSISMVIYAIARVYIDHQILRGGTEKHQAALLTSPIV